MNNIWLSRRSFIKALGALGLVAALPPIAARAAPLELPARSFIDEAIIDAPITEETPLAWIRLNEEKVSIVGFDLTIKHDFNLSADGFYFPNRDLTTCEISFDSKSHYPVIDKYMNRGEVIDFEISIPGYEFSFSGKSLIVEMSSDDRSAVISTRMNTIGPLMAKVS